MKLHTEDDNTHREQPIPLSDSVGNSHSPSMVSDDRAVFEQLLNDFQAKGAESQPKGQKGQPGRRPTASSRSFMG
jgi:hypothetical protein